MTTFLDLLGLGFRPRIVFDTGGDGGGGDSRPDSAKALDETDGTSAADAYQQYADTMAEAGVRNLAGAGTSAYEQAQALAGRDDDDDEPSFSPLTVGIPDPLSTDPDEDYRDVLNFALTGNEPSGMFQGPTLDADIDPLGLDSFGTFTPINVPEISDIDLEFGGASPADTRPVADTRSFTTFTDPDQTGLEDFAQARPIVDDFMTGLDPFDAETVEQLADQYYEFGSDPMSVAEQVSNQRIAPDVLDSLRSSPSFLDEIADKSSMIDPMNPPVSLSDDDMGLPNISVDQAMFTRGELGRGDFGGAGAAPVEVQQPADIPDYEGVDQDAINKLVAGVLTGTPVEGADVITSKIGMPRDGLEGVLGNALGSPLGILGMDVMFPGIGAVLSLAAIFDPQKRQEIADMLSSGEGSAVYDSQGRLLGVTNKETGKYTGYSSDDGGFIYDDDGNLIRSSAGVPKRPVLNLNDDDDDEGDDGCPSGFVRNPVTGVCEPIDDGVGDTPPISGAPRPVRPRDPSPAPDRPDPVDPGDGMIIRQPTFATGGIVGYQQGGDVDAESYDFSPFQETGFGTSDTTLMMRHQLGLDTFDDNQMNMYDLNNDGMVDQTDIDAGFQFITGNPDLNVMQHVQKRAIRERDPTPIRSKDPVGDPVLTSPAAPAQGMSIRSVGFQEGGPVTPNIDNFLRTFRG